MKLFKMFTINQDQVTTARAAAKPRTSAQALKWFTSRICGGVVCAEPLETEDVEEWDQTLLLGNPFRTIEAIAHKEGYSVEHIAIAGEMIEWYGQGYLKPEWRIYIYCSKPQP
jgi:hypothetical protein